MRMSQATRDRLPSWCYLVRSNPSNLVGIFAHARLVRLDDGQPELRVRSTDLHRDITIKTVIVKDDVKVRLSSSIIPPDRDIAAVRITVQRGVFAKDHLVEDAGQSGRHLVAVDPVCVEILEVVEAVAGQIFHH